MSRSLIVRRSGLAFAARPGRLDRHHEQDRQCVVRHPALRLDIQLDRRLSGRQARILPSFGSLDPERI
jgi:hypothetical protein